MDARCILNERLDAHEQGARQEEGRQEEAGEVAEGEARREACKAGHPRLTLPAHTARLVERTLAAYCGRFCPPGRRQLRLGFSMEPAAAVIYELRDRCGVAGMPRPVPVARFRYQAGAGDWRLDYTRDEPARWRPYPNAGAASFTALLRVFDEDALGLFWGRVNGASLRWCSPRGRCADCAARQRAALGWLPPPRPAAVVPLRG